MSPTQATIIMDKEPVDRYLLRWSSTAPEVFTATYTGIEPSGSKKTGHWRMKADQTFSDFIDEMENKERINLSLDLKRTSKTTKLVDYASSSKPYYD